MKQLEAALAPTNLIICAQTPLATNMGPVHKLLPCLSPPENCQHLRFDVLPSKYWWHSLIKVFFYCGRFKYVSTKCCTYLNENIPFLSFSQVLDFWFEQVAREKKYDVRYFATELVKWGRQGWVKNTVFNEIAVHLFPQFVPLLNRVIDWEIDKDNFSVTCEQGRILLFFLAQDSSRSGAFN